MSVLEKIRAYENAAAQRNAVERTQITAEVSQLRTETHAAMAAADSIVGAQGSAAQLAQTTLREEAEQALQSVVGQGSSVIANTGSWARSEEVFFKSCG